MAADWVELRVHGVSGTPPEAMLLHPHVRQVAGDDVSRFFRPVDAAGQELRAGDDQHVLEGFHWGKHTAGEPRQAAWLLLIPFGLINAAQFMLPKPSTAGARWAHAVCGAALRLLGGLMTGALVLGIAEILADLGVWQWLRGRAVVGPRVATFLLIVAFVVVALAAWILSRLGRRSSADEVRPGDLAGAPWTKTPTDLARPSFYTGRPGVPALTWLHRALSVAVVGTLAWAVAAKSSTVAAWPSVVQTVLLGLVLVGLVALGDPENSARVTAKTAGGKRQKTTFRAAAALCVLALGWAVFALVEVAFSGLAVEPRMLPGMQPLTVLLFAGGVGTALVLVVANAALAFTTRTEPGDGAAWDRFMRGMAAAMVAAWGTWLGTGFTAANAFVVRELLNRGKGLDVVVPDALKDVAQAWGVGTIVLGLIALWLVLRTWRRSRHTLGTGRFLADARRAMTVPRTASAPALPETWLRRVAGAMSAARLKNRLPVLVLVAAVVGLGLGLLSSWRLFGACDPGVWPAPACAGRVSAAGQLLAVGPVDATATLDKITAFLAAVGTAELVFLQGRLLAIGWQAVRATETRRGLAVIWDVVAFWPRSAHPFTPYPYSQRVVHDLVRRMRWHLADPERRVVVTAHSQGTVISLAALLWLGPDDRKRVGLLTYGSQLRQQYARAFPAFVSRELLAEVYDGYDKRWRSLYRDTDPIGGPVLSWDHDRDSATKPGSRRLDSGAAQKVEDCYDTQGVRRCGPEWRLLDPEPPPGGEDAVAPVLPLLKHSDYPASGAWPAALEDVLPAAPPG